MGTLESLPQVCCVVGTETNIYWINLEAGKPLPLILYAQRLDHPLLNLLCLPTEATCRTCHEAAVHDTCTFLPSSHGGGGRLRIVAGPAARRRDGSLR